MGVPLVVIGTILFLVRWTDVITDPLVGYLSDHTRSRFGRRKVWIALATPLMMLSVFQLFLPDLGQVWMRPIYGSSLLRPQMNWVHLALWSFMLSVAITMMLIPYYAWGSELSTDYHERSKVTGSRAVFNSLGSLSAQLIPAMALLIFGIGGSSVVLELVGLTMLVLMPICVTLTLTNVAEAPYQPRQQVSVLAGLKLMAANGPFKRLGVSLHDWLARPQCHDALVPVFYCRCFAGGRQGDLYAQLFLCGEHYRRAILGRIFKASGQA